LQEGLLWSCASRALSYSRVALSSSALSLPPLWAKKARVTSLRAAETGASASRRVTSGWRAPSSPWWPPAWALSSGGGCAGANGGRHPRHRGSCPASAERSGRSGPGGGGSAPHRRRRRQHGPCRRASDQPRDRERRDRGRRDRAHGGEPDQPGCLQREAGGHEPLPADAIGERARDRRELDAAHDRLPS